MENDKNLEHISDKKVQKPDISNRELLIAYTKWLSTQKFDTYSTRMVDAFLSNLK